MIRPILASTLALAMLQSSAMSQQVGTQVGDYYPDLELPTIDGKDMRLSSLRGKKLLLIEFASW